MPKVANGIDLVWRPWQVHAENFEYELRHGLVPKKAGVVRLLAYTNYANMGIYREAIAQFEQGLVPVPDITNHPWHITRKYGFGANVEQSLTSNLRPSRALAGTMAKPNRSPTPKSTLPLLRVWGREVQVSKCTTGTTATQNDMRLSAGIVLSMGGNPTRSSLALACSASPAPTFPGDPVTVTATASNLDPKLNVVYTWAGVPGLNANIKIQKPSCCYYATEKHWSDAFDRVVKEDARPILILAPMHPVMLVYDLDDTDGPPLPDKLANFSKTEGEWDARALENTLANAERDRILVQFKPLSSLHGGFATTRLRDGRFKMRVVIHEELNAKRRYTVLCHELAHIYLGHLGSDKERWWPFWINLSHATVEIEAEAVAFIVSNEPG